MLGVACSRFDKRSLHRNIDYLGWAGKQDQDNYDDCNIVSVKFIWDDDDPDKEVKPMVMASIQCSAVVLGTSF